MLVVLDLPEVELLLQPGLTLVHNLNVVLHSSGLQAAAETAEGGVSHHVELELG